MWFSQEQNFLIHPLIGIIDIFLVVCWNFENFIETNALESLTEDMVAQNY